MSFVDIIVFCQEPLPSRANLLVGLVIILTTNFMAIGGIIFEIQLLLIPWLAIYTVGKMIIKVHAFHGFLGSKNPLQIDSESK